MDFTINSGRGVTVSVSEKECDAVKIAVSNLRSDLEKVFGALDGGGARIIVGTLGVNEEISEYIDRDTLKDDNGSLRREAFFVASRGGTLALGGTDRRGTIYAVYDFCEYIGVSPWYFFADVPPKRKRHLEIPDGYLKTDYPSVEYRGIFINDEEELDRWARLYMGEETIGLKTYEKIFELILRLKGNYIWPAMHVNSFNVRRENGELADRMGLTVGTSHCDMLMRSNNREWYPWLKKKGYEGVEYDYSIEGRNRDILREYWRESIEQNKDFEVSYTLGMRGIHDSGFEVSAFEGCPKEELTQKKIELLEKIIGDQEEMLSEIVGDDVLKIFVPYKEVLNLYDAGLDVPEDLTLIWSNDNYGHVRRYPSEKERARKGGNGIYYHNSYWAPACASYLFINSIPLAHTKNELSKAYAEGIRKLWVMNVGALKPIELETEFFLRYAWEIGKETTTADVERFTAQWIDKTFSGSHGAECADILCSFDAVANSRKVEFLDNGVFSTSAYGDEYTERINRLLELYRRANDVYFSLPAEEKAAFYELVLMKIHAGYFMNAQYFYADESIKYAERGIPAAAQRAAELSHEFDNRRRELIHYFNRVLLAGKWNGILLPETFPPPVTAMHPACMPPIDTPAASEMKVSVWNDEDELVFVDDEVKWIEVMPTGAQRVVYWLSAPDWLALDKVSGVATDATRILIKPLEFGKSDEIAVVSSKFDMVKIPVRAEKVDGVNVEDGGMVSVEATSAVKNHGWKEIPRLGRDIGSLMEATETSGEIAYEFTATKGGEATVEVLRFPSLNSTGEITARVAIDGKETAIKSESNDEHCGNWAENVLNEVDRLTFVFGDIKPGKHTLSITASKYFAFSRVAIYFGERGQNNGGRIYKGLLQDTPWIPMDFYGAPKLPPRPQVYGVTDAPKNTLIKTSHAVYEDRYADPRPLKNIIASGKEIFAQRGDFIEIDALSALAQTDYAATTGDFTYCDSPSYGGTSCAIYVPGKIRRFKKTPDAAPRMRFRVRTDKSGRCTVWVLTKEPRDDAPYIGLAIDGTRVPAEELTGKGKLWRYEYEQIWHWTPLYAADLTSGEHTVEIYSLTTGIKFDRICVCAGDAEPPADTKWEGNGTKMKYIVILGDGMADYPVSYFDGKTILEVADKPVIDDMCRHGELGMCKTVQDGMKPGSDVANLSVMGYDTKKCYTGRSPLEAASIGVEMKDDDVTFRTNLVTLSDEEDYAEKTMLDYSSGEITTEESAQLIEAIAKELDTDRIKFYPGISYRHLCVWNGGSTNVELTPPHDISDKKVGAYLPKGDGADKLLEMMKASEKILRDHPVNKDRIKRGLNPATSIWVWGEGTKPSVGSFYEKYGLKGAVISAVDLIKGIAKCAGMESIDVPGATGNCETNWDGKAQAALDALLAGNDFVYVHMEAPDEMGHQGKPDKKKFAVETIDHKVVKFLKDELEARGIDYRMLIMPDHPTPIALKTHVSDPVPYVIYDSTDRDGGSGMAYTEANGRKTGVYIEKGYTLMDRFLQRKGK